MIPPRAGRHRGSHGVRVRHLSRVQRRAGQTDAEAFAQSFAQVDAAERWGLDVVWLAELHFLPERSVASAPLVLASAIATRTRRLKIGIAVQVLPLCHPLRLAEEVATLDHVSGGRLIFGVGRSGFPRTYEAYGVPYDGKPRALRRGARDPQALLERASASPSRATSTSTATSRSSPRPLQKPHPPLRIAATSADTYPAIGAMGLPIFVAVRLGTIEELGPNIAAYREAYRAAGHPGQGEVYLRVPIYVGETEAGGAGRPGAFDHAVLRDARRAARGLGDRGQARAPSSNAPSGARRCRRSATTTRCATR